jgi:FkbM family methyltransferase
MEVEYVVNDKYRQHEETWRKEHPGGILNFEYHGETFYFYLPFKRDVIQSYMIYNKTFYELAQLEELRKYIKDSGIEINTIIDVGANIGNHTIYLTKMLGALHTYSFEPFEPAYDTLVDNICLNKLCFEVSAYNIALGDNDMPAKVFYTNSVHEKDNIGNTKIMQCPEGDMKVSVLDDINIPNKIDFMKIDVEGFEARVILGAKETILRDKPLIWVESFPENFVMTNYILETLGYEIVKEMSEANYIYRYKGN